MPSRDEIRAVYDDPQVNGMDDLYEAIGRAINDGADFDRAYQLVVATGGPAAKTWIRFCVQCSTRFDEPPEESEFLAVLEEFSRQTMSTKRSDP